MLITVVVVVVILLVVGIAAGVIVTMKSTSTSNSTSSSVNSSTFKPIRIVAAENFWGSLITPLGGNRVSVVSIVTDPNTDPHEFESNTQDAEAIANASLVIVNGADYDDWALAINRGE